LQRCVGLRGCAVHVDQREGTDHHRTVSPVVRLGAAVVNDLLALVLRALRGDVRVSVMKVKSNTRARLHSVSILLSTRTRTRTRTHTHTHTYLEFGLESLAETVQLTQIQGPEVREEGLVT
jgi:hypothetical protein